MLDTVSQQRLVLVHPELSRRVTQLSTLLSFDIRVNQGRRTYPEQDVLWHQGRNQDGTYIDPVHHIGVVTNARGGHSAHNFCYAVDVAPIVNGVIDWNGKDEKWAEVLREAANCDLAEGATWRTFPDEPHLYLKEMPADPDDNLRYIFTEGGMDAIYAEIDRILAVAKGA